LDWSFGWVFVQHTWAEKEIKIRFISANIRHIYTKVAKIFQILHGQNKKMKNKRKFNKKALKRPEIGKLRWGLDAKRQNQGRN